ncbi:MAG: hypothetical protein JXP72_00465 [Coriobacteriia bacterium]|nr:hypothetical protein [Coriobacteriia bacterium]
MSEIRTQVGAGQASSHHGPSWRTAVFLAVIGLFVGLLTGMPLGYNSAISQVRDANAEAAQARADLEKIANVNATLQERNWSFYLDSLKTGQDEPAEPVTPTARETGVYTEGTYLVDIDIQPGTYRGECTGEFGYWARLRNTTGMVNGIIANNVVRGPFVVTILPADVAIELRGVTLRAAE